MTPPQARRSKPTERGQDWGSEIQRKKRKLEKKKEEERVKAMRIDRFLLGMGRFGIDRGFTHTSVVDMVEYRVLYDLSEKDAVVLTDCQKTDLFTSAISGSLDIEQQKRWEALYNNYVLKE